MSSPSGPLDKSRFDGLPANDREYRLFCADFFHSVLERRPEHVEALAGAANTLTELGYYADGLEFDRRLAQISPHDPVVLYNLACSLALVHLREEALDALENAVSAGYKDATHMQSDTDLAALRDDPRFVSLVYDLATGTARE